MWSETVERWCDYWKNKFPEYESVIENELKPAVLNLDDMPSMRSLMTAGDALDRCNVAGYNCAYLTIESLRDFDEMLYILMNGTGVGYSVERQYVSQLPTIAEEFHESDTTIVVKDSKLGWAKAFKELLSLLSQGEIPNWDLSKIRPAGSRLKTFGGRASGPEPLNNLFEFTTSLFRKAAGRKLSSLECHDLCCKVAEIVVVGGVRRSALISLSNLSDDRMRVAKSGQWWIDNPQRALANNSAAYTEKPEFEIFLKEWNSLYESKSGERGIFSRVAAQKQAAKNERRDSNYDFGFNPCVTYHSEILTDSGYEYIGDLEGELVNIWNGAEWSEVEPYSTGENEIVRVSFTNASEIECTPYHKFPIEQIGMVEAQNLKEEMKLEEWEVPAVPFGVEHSVDIRVKSVEWTGREEKTFCVTEPKRNQMTVNGIVTGNCGEIILRPKQFCNLSEVVIRPDDTFEKLKEKVRIAAIIGTFQSTLTNFRYLRKQWENNTKEERLLGVSLTGIMDHPILNGTEATDNPLGPYWDRPDQDLDQILYELQEVAVKTNKEWSEKLGIEQSTAVTCVKPSGTVSQLFDSSRGIHPRFS